MTPGSVAGIKKGALIIAVKDANSSDQRGRFDPLCFTEVLTLEGVSAALTTEIAKNLELSKGSSKVTPGNVAGIKKGALIIAVKDANSASDQTGRIKY